MSAVQYGYGDSLVVGNQWIIPPSPDWTDWDQKRDGTGTPWTIINLDTMNVKVCDLLCSSRPKEKIPPAAVRSSSKDMTR